ncbi:MAG TPA: beta-propeller fold lactonase family protein [Candidatus Angelobacter sp.]|nr:beta-propeller fold lactonase family protein [Candidatus Angelobacter sp.]
MKNLASAGSTCVLAVLLILLLIGCGGVRSSSAPAPTPTPVPPGATPTPTPAAAHGTFVYFNNSASQVTGYRLNPDGTLSPLAGSPFTINGALAAAGSFLAVSSGSTVSTYMVDSSSGALTNTGSAAVVQASGITADARNVYVSGSIPASTSTGVYGFALAANGALTPLAGSPYVFTQACDFCDVPFALALNNNFLIQGGVGFHGVGDFTVYPRGAGGVLSKAQILGTDAEESVTIQRPAGKFAYALNTDDFSLNEYTIDASGKPSPGMQMFFNGAQNITIDTTGKFLLLVDNTGVVHVLTIDPSNGNFSQIGTSEAAGSNPGGMAMDPSGHFIFVPQAANPNFAGSTNQITVFTFDPATGMVKKLQPFPQPGPPGGVVVIAR